MSNHTTPKGRSPPYPVRIESPRISSLPNNLQVMDYGLSITSPFPTFFINPKAMP